MCATKHDDTDVTDEQWELIQSVLPAQKWKPGDSGRPPSDVRQALNGILSLNKTGCQWRLMPKEFGQRRLQGHPPEPSAGSIDSQSIKTATQHEDIGYDGHKKIKERKRHLLVDTVGLIMGVVVTDAGTDDRWGQFAHGSRFRQRGQPQLVPSKGLF